MTKTSHVQQADTTVTKFLDALAAAEHKAGVYLFKGFVSDTEADELFVELNDDTKVPWNLKPVIGGERLTSHACDFKRTEKEIRKWSGIFPCSGITSRECSACRTEKYLPCRFVVI